MHQELIPHLFRTEFHKISSVLCKHLGIEHIDVAEDLASETFTAALETWPYRGIPEEPTAWLYAVAKNKARNFIQRNKIFTNKIYNHTQSQSIEVENTEINLSDSNILDSQLQMLFTICHPSISTESQIGLALRILCGFGIDEIATAFLTKKETINKRLFRAKEKLRLEKVKIEVPTKTEINNRLETVLITLYLLFNEGYYSESQHKVIREELCLEAMRLNLMLIQNELTNTPAVNALLALMCFQSSRFEARKNEQGDLILYQDQDESLWNKELIAKGAYYLNQAARDNNISKYHLEAAIAYWHSIKTETKEKWETILQLYNHLLQIEYSPIADLNRLFALSKARNKMEAIKEAENLQLSDNHYYFTLLGELYKEIDKEKARIHLQNAISLAKTLADKNIITKYLQSL